MKRLRAFSMVELMVAMIVSSIVIGVALTVYMNLNQYYQDFKEKGKIDSELLLLVSTMRADMEKSYEVHGDNSDLTMVFEAGKTINYSFEGKFILRKIDDVTDTFYNPIQEVEVNYLDNENKYVNDLLVNIKQVESIFPLHITKEYSRDLLFYIDPINNEH
ncbi:MAG: prepilin-type N-terminal cleavage/methylation domain-containing protein [Bacteroidia bacterium]|nr:prepilin-type N-terminal cleavage/methylation domain-containing protein [Bacteroidia bacterium]